MGAIAPINFEKCLFAPIEFDKKDYCNHHYLSLMGANLLFITSLHPSIENPKEGPGYTGRAADGGGGSTEMICFLMGASQHRKTENGYFSAAGWLAGAIAILQSVLSPLIDKLQLVDSVDKNPGGLASLFFPGYYCVLARLPCLL